MDIRKLANMAKFFWRKNGPQITVGVGVTGLIGAGVYACVKTTKVQPILEDHKKRKDEGQSKAKLYLVTTGKMAKHYAVPLLIGGLSTFGIFKGTSMLLKTNAELAAAYIALDEGFKEYRKGVVEQYGAEVDEKLRKGLKTVEIEYEDGTKESFEAVTDESQLHKDYRWIFAKGTSNYARVSTFYNMSFLLDAQNYFNSQLKYNGFLFVNDVLRYLGLPLVSWGWIVGWVFDKDTDVFGDNYVKLSPKEVRRLDPDSGEYENVIMIELNVDGPVAAHMQR